MSVIILTTGQPGAGKSYSRVRWLMQDFLINSTGLYITNLPLLREDIAREISEETNKDYEYILNRIIIIPDEEMKGWRDLSQLSKEDLKKIKDDDGFRPLEYLSQFDLQGAHVAIDEFHRYFGAKDPIQLRKIWNDFFAEIRKLGITFEAITQDVAQLPRDFNGKVGKKIDLVPFSNERDFIFKIPMADWYELRSGLFKLNERTVVQTETIKTTSESGSIKWKITHVEKFKLEDYYFKFYQSFQKTENKGKVVGYTSPSQRLGWRVIFWFLRLHWFVLLWKIGLCAFMLWLCFFGGLTYVIDYFTSTLHTMASGNGLDVKKSPYSNKTPVQFDIKKQLDSSTYFPVPKEDYTIYTPLLFNRLEKYVVLKNGEKLNENSFIKEGFKAGQKIEINFSNRYIVIDSVFIRMSRTVSN